VRAFLDACENFHEEILSLTDPDEDLPLHIACMFCCSEVIEYLMTTCPEALARANNDGFLPLHVALGAQGVINNNQINSKVLIKIMKLYPEAVADDGADVDSDGRCTLTLALANRNCPLDAIQCLIELYPDDMRALYLRGVFDHEGGREVGAAEDGAMNKIYMDSGRAEALANLLPRLILLDFELHRTSWDSLDTLFFLLKQLEKHPHIYRLMLTLPANLQGGNSKSMFCSLRCVSK
jgi:hypothetical protein